MRIDYSILLAAVLSYAGASGQEGQLDPSFGVNGIASLAVDSITLLDNDMFVQSDGRILTTGRCSNGQGWDLYVVRCLPEGQLDTTFGDQGFVRTDLGTFWDQGFAITVDNEGRIIVAAEWSESSFTPVVSVVRYQSDGSLDGSFGTGGVANPPVSAYGHPEDLMVNGDGAIIVVGSNSAYDAIAMYQFTDAGVLDNSFGSGGFMTVSPFGGVNVATQVLVQDDGRIVLACMHGPSGAYDVALMRFLPNGSFDPSFGNGGIAPLSVSPGDETASGAGLQSNGGFVVTGTSQNSPNYDMFLARFTSDGILDTSFGSDGVILVSPSFASDGANDLVIQDDGAILLCGRSDQGEGNSHVAVVRTLPSGQLDPAFGTGGIVLTALPGVSYAVGYEIGLQPDGRVIVAAGGGTQPLLLRYLAGPFIGFEESGDLGAGLTLFPNPVSEHAVMQYAWHSDAHVVCELVDAQGRSVRSFFHTELTTGICRASLDMSGIAAGPYTLVMRSAAERMSVRVLKQ